MDHLAVDVEMESIETEEECRQYLERVAAKGKGWEQLKELLAILKKRLTFLNSLDGATTENLAERQAKAEAYKEVIGYISLGIANGQQAQDRFEDVDRKDKEGG